jgi:hypothetical protein
MALDISTGFDATIVKANLIEALRPYSVNLAAFTTDFGTEAVGPFTTVSTVVPTMSTGSIKTAGGNYQDTSGTGSRVYVTLDRQFYAQTSFEAADVVKYGLESCLATFGKQVAAEYVRTVQEAAFGYLTVANFPSYISASGAVSSLGYDELVDAEVVLFTSGSRGPKAAILDGKLFGQVKKDTKDMQISATNLGVGSIGDTLAIAGFGNVYPSTLVTKANIATTGSAIPRGIVVTPAALAVVSRPTVDIDPNALFNEVIVDPGAGAYRMKMTYDGVSRDRYIVRATGFFSVAVGQAGAGCWICSTN